MTHHYTAFGLTIRSQIQCPLMQHRADDIDVNIQLGMVPTHLTGSENPDAWYQAAAHQLLLKIPEVARFLIESGNRITIAPISDDFDYINVFLLGSAMGGLLHQRGHLVLHANAIALDDEAILIAGPQGYGKSTLAAAFLQRGYSLLADDVCAIEFKEDRPYVHPSYPQIKLCQDMVKPIGYNASELKPIGHNINKYYVPIHKHFYSECLPITKIIILDKSDEASCCWQAITGADKLKELLHNTYRPQFIEVQALTLQHFDHCVQLMQNIPLMRLMRPVTGFSAFDLVSTIIQLGD